MSGSKGNGAAVSDDLIDGKAVGALIKRIEYNIAYPEGLPFVSEHVNAFDAETPAIGTAEKCIIFHGLPFFLPYHDTLLQ